MFMYHPDYQNLGKGSYYHNGYKGFKENSVFDIADLVLAYANSPCLWSHGKRLKKNFVAADWLGLDFDVGLSLKEGLNIFAPYAHIIGTTKSHQVDKKGIKCDRFRVFLRFEKTCFSKDDYEETCRHWVFKYGGDKACVDAARFFWPCKKIISIEDGGKRIGVLDGKNPEKAERKKKFKAKQKRIDEEYEKYGSLPPWVYSLVKGGCEHNQRNIISLKIGIRLLSLGYREDEIVDLIKDSQIPKSGDHDFTEEEIEKCVNNARKYV